MRFILRPLVLTAAAFFATSAFAAQKTTVNVPFNFESHGQAFPAGRYEVSLDMRTNIIKLSNAEDTKKSVMWIVGPAEDNPISPSVRIMFDDAGYVHELHSIQLGARITPVLDAPTKHHYAGSSVVTGGQ
jgi:hypothetical protein